MRLSGDRHTHLDFHYLRCALGKLAYEHYRHSNNLVARLNLLNMQYPAGSKVKVYAQVVRGLTKLEPDPEKQLKYLDFIDIYAVLDDNERAEYQRDYPDEAKTMSRFAERFLEEGMQLGMHQGEASVLERQLRLKFGTLTRCGTVADRASQRADPATVVRAGPHRQPSRRGSAMRMDQACRP